MFIVLGLTFRPLIHEEFFFLYDVSWRSNSIILHMYVHFPQNHLLRSLFFPIEWSRDFCEKSLDIYAIVYFRALYSIPLTFMSVFMPVSHYFDYCNFVVSFEIWICEFSNFVFLFEDFSFFFFFLYVLGLMNFHRNFNLSVAAKRSDDIWVELHWICRLVSGRVFSS